MKQIRLGAFETNSSSTHCLTLMTAEEFERWQRGESWYDALNKEVYPIDDFDADDDDAVSFERANINYDLDYAEVVVNDTNYVVVSFTIDNH